jgi:hypothetical protein
LDLISMNYEESEKNPFLDNKKKNEDEFPTFIPNRSYIPETNEEEARQMFLHFKKLYEEDRKEELLNEQLKKAEKAKRKAEKKAKQEPVKSVFSGPQTSVYFNERKKNDLKKKAEKFSKIKILNIHNPALSDSLIPDYDEEETRKFLNIDKEFEAALKKKHLNDQLKEAQKAKRKEEQEAEIEKEKVRKQENQELLNKIVCDHYMSKHRKEMEEKSIQRRAKLEAEEVENLRIKAEKKEAEKAAIKAEKATQSIKKLYPFLSDFQIFDKFDKEKYINAEFLDKCNEMFLNKCSDNLKMSYPFHVTENYLNCKRISLEKLEKDMKRLFTPSGDRSDSDNLKQWLKLSRKFNDARLDVSINTKLLRPLNDIVNIIYFI